MVIPLLAAGGIGVISVLSNVLPKEVSDVAKLYFAGKNEQATILQEKLLPLIDIMFCEVNPIPVKAALTGDVDEAIRALMINPLVFDYKKAKPCFEEMKEAHKHYLPQFFKKEN